MLNKALKAVKRALKHQKKSNPDNPKKNPAYNKIYEAIQNDTGLRIRKELFSDRLMISFDDEKQTELNDYDITEIILRLGNNGLEGNIGRRIVEEVIDYIGYLNSYDEPQEWLNGITWDGVERIPSFFANIWGVENNEYHKFAGEYLWTALAACIAGDEVSKDIMIVLVGNQGIGKSTFIRNLVPYSKWYTSINFHMSETETVLKIIGCLVAEFAELAGLARKELEHVKAFLTEIKYRIRRIYKRSYDDYVRRCLFIGSTNKREFLTDEENRRYLVIELGSKNANFSHFKNVLEQLWAEGNAKYQKHGILHKNAEFEAKKYHHQFEIISTIEEALIEYLNSEQIQNKNLTILEIINFLQTKKIILGNSDQKIRNEIGKILRKFGFERVIKKNKQTTQVVWTKK